MPTPYEKILIEADTSNDEVHLGCLWLQIIKYQDNFKRCELMFAREHFNNLAEQLALRKGADVKQVKYNVFNPV